MRGPTPEEVLKTPPPDLRMGTKSTQAFMDIRRKILTSEYGADDVLTMRSMKDLYNLNNIESQIIFLRLAIEGLVKVLPAREKTWPNYAAYNEYRVADINVKSWLFSTPHGDLVADVSQESHSLDKETLVLKIQYADAEVARLLNIAEGEQVIYYRNLQRWDSENIICINDQYLPFWFAPMIPELEKPDSNVYQLMLRLGKKPSRCTETIDVVQASSVERVLFGMSPDDPLALLKILRRSFDEEGHPMDVQFLSNRSNTYRLHYSFPLFANDIPEARRDK
jgi:hypothetical protein